MPRVPFLDFLHSPRQVLLRLAVCSPIVLAALQYGCASIYHQRPDTTHQTTSPTTAVVAGGGMPDIRFEPIVHGPGEGALRGAGPFFVDCVSRLGAGACSGPYCPGAMILLVGLCGVGTAALGIAGAVTAPTEAEVAEAHTTVTVAVDPEAVQNALREAVTVAAVQGGTVVVEPPQGLVADAVRTGDYRQFAHQGIDTVLEVSVTEAGAAGADAETDAAVTVYLNANARLIRTLDNSVLFAREYRYRGERLPLSSLAIDGTGPVIASLQTGYSSLGTTLYDGVFRLYPFPDRRPQGAGLLSVAYGLAPIYPPTRGAHAGSDFFADRYFLWHDVGTLQPTLQWQAFPRDADRTVMPDEMARVTHVAYDLLIASEQGAAPAEVVYRRTGLAAPVHTLEVPLSADTRFFWTVRARFELDGRERFTEWGSTNDIARDNIAAPSRYSYRFRTSSSADHAAGN